MNLRGKRMAGGMAAIVAACGAVGSVWTVTGQPALAQTQPRPAIFAQCIACHTIERGRNGFGPSLAGVGGRRAASLPDYTYSPALKASGLSWTAASLDIWLTSPQKAVPGTKMPFRGIADPVRRKEVIDYLLTLK